MDFSETYKHSGPCVWSPDGKMLAVAVDFRLVVRDVDTLQVIQLFSCLDKINQVEWASDSTYILCALYKRSLIQVWSVAQPEWICKIDNGPAGLAYARWLPDGRGILATSSFQLKITFWSLVTKHSESLQWPKLVTRGVSFSHDGKFAAVATRRDCKDYVNVLTTSMWELVTKFEVGTSDLADLAWSPDNGSIAVWDSVLDYKMLIYSADGRFVARYTAYENGLGIKTAAWNPTGQMLAIGSFDQTVRVLNHLSWKPLGEFIHTPVIKPGTAVVYREIEEGRQVVLGENAGRGVNGAQFREAAVAAADAQGAREGPTKARYEVAEEQVTIPSKKAEPDKPNPKQGIGLLEWSPDGDYFATRNDNMPNAIWVWAIREQEPAAILLQKDPTKAAAWDPSGTRLAIVTGNARVYLWSSDGASCVHVPLAGFHATGVRWNPAGNSFVLLDKDTFCCAFLARDEGH